MTSGGSPLDLLVIGDLNPDLIVTGGDMVPRFGQVEQLVESADLVLGGSGAIVASGAAKLGLSVGLCAVVGDDELGAMVRRWVEGAGVDTSHVRIDRDRATGVSVILAAPGGRAILTSPGAIDSLAPGDLAGLPARSARHVHAASTFLMSHDVRAALPETLRRFSAAGATTSVDTNWDPAEEWETRGLLEAAHLFLPNAAELTAITGEPDVEGALAAWAHPADVAVKLGEAGGACRAGETFVRIAAPPVPGLVDTIGAGDGFDAGYLAGFLGGRSPVSSLALAVAVGALSTRGAGGTAAQPNLAEAERCATTLVTG